MSHYRKVVWNEGMLLSPHHLQQWDNYYEDQITSRFALAMPYEWGIVNLQINHESINNGFFELVHCQAIMPDGLMVNIPQPDPLPEPRPLAKQFETSTERVEIYLAIAAKRIGGANFQSPNGDKKILLRYGQTPATVIDETVGENEQQLAFAKPNFRLLFADELKEGYSSIKIAEVIRTATGQLALSDAYIPPALTIGANGWLLNSLRQLIEILITKSTTLGDQRRQRATSLADFTTSEVAAFWLLHTVNGVIPKLTHLLRTRIVHPERLYEAFVELAGQLMTFSTTHHPKDIVRYDHTDLFSTFGQLIAQIRELLETVIPTRCVAIPLENTRESIYVGRIQDERLLREAAFFLAVKAHVPESFLIDRVPRIIKIASQDVIDAVVGSALPGVTLRHASPPPSPIPTRVGFHYFGFDSIGPYWDTIRGSKTIAIYVPNEFPEVKLELYAVKP